MIILLRSFLEDIYCALYHSRRPTAEEFSSQPVMLIGKFVIERYQECQECVKTSVAHLHFVVLFDIVELWLLIIENRIKIKQLNKKKLINNNWQLDRKC